MRLKNAKMQIAKLAKSGRAYLVRFKIEGSERFTQAWVSKGYLKKKGVQNAQNLEIGSVFKCDIMCFNDNQSFEIRMIPENIEFVGVFQVKKGNNKDKKGDKPDSDEDTAF